MILNTLQLIEFGFMIFLQQILNQTQLLPCYQLIRLSWKRQDNTNLKGKFPFMTFDWHFAGKEYFYDLGIRRDINIFLGILRFVDDDV